MAKENEVNLEGYIEKLPKVKVTPEGKIVLAEFELTTMRRLGVAGTKTLPMEFSFPKIRTRNSKMINIVAGLKLGDYVRVKGTIATKKVNKKKGCPNPACKEKGIFSSTEGILTYVNALFVEVMETGLFDLDDEGNVIDKKRAVEKLKERSEVSNGIKCIGALVRDVSTYSDPERPKVHATKYQIACNRKYIIPEDGPDVKTDYPYCISYGSRAVEDAEILQEGSVVYINGFLRSKRVVRSFVCPECGEPYNWIDPVLEIIPWGVEFLFKNKDEIVDVEEYAEDHLAEYANECIGEVKKILS